MNVDALIATVLVYDIGLVALRRMRDQQEDYRSMATWLSDERVLEYYDGRDNAHTIGDVMEKYGPRAKGKDIVVPCIIALDGESIGYLQYYPLDQHTLVEYNLESNGLAYGVDLFIGEPDLWSKGIGTAALNEAVKYLFDALGAITVTIDPRTSNHRAIRSYEKCGFRKFKILPDHEYHEGEHQDCWLMTIGG